MKESLQYFFDDVGSTQLLSKEEEIELSKKIEKGDQQARDHMIRANMRLAISIAKKFAKKNMDLDDLIQESSVGLIKAVDRFDWRKGFKFSTYACWWINQSVRQHIANHGGSIKLPSYARNTLFKMKEAAEEYRETFGTEPTHEEIAEILGIGAETLKALISSASTPVEIDCSPLKGSDDSGRTMHEVLVDKTNESVDNLLDRDKMHIAITEALRSLTPREEAVLRLRFGLVDDLEIKKE